MAWYEAACLFEDLADAGLTKAADIERAYKADVSLMWRLVNCFLRVSLLNSELYGKLDQVITYSPYYRDKFKRWRVSLVTFGAVLNSVS
jgi:hypothetical protein